MSRPTAAQRHARSEPRSVRMAGDLGRGAIDNLRMWGELFATLSAAFASLFAPGRAARDTVRQITVKQVFFTGVQGLPFVTATALIIGATMMLQTEVATPGLNGEVMGRIITAVVLRELAPLVTAIIITSRSGTAIATELGNMQANLEVHALSSMGIDPPRYVVQPRMIGVIVAVLVLTVYFTILAIIGSFASVWALGNVSLIAVRNGIAQALGWGDVLLFTIRGVGCGLLIGWVCCHFGLKVQSSTTEVPMMTGRAVIRALVGCVVFNFAVTLIYYAVVGLPTA